MSDEPPEDISKERLWNELQELKQHVYPSRRDVLKAGTAAAGAGMIGFGAGNASAQASTSDGDGNVGDPNDRVDVFGDGVDSNSVSDNITDRPLWTTQDTTVNVPADYNTIQAAVNDIPVILNHSYEITIDDGDYSTEDVLVPQTYGGRAMNTGISWEHKLQITGNQTTPANVKIGSIVMNGCVGGIFRVRGLQLQNDNPHDDENTPFAAYYCNEATLAHAEFAGGTSGPVGYGGYLVLKDVDLGTGVLTGSGVMAKHGGVIYEQIAGGDPPAAGNVGGYAYESRQGCLIGIAGNTSTISGDSGFLNVDGQNLTGERNGLGSYFDMQNREWLGVQKAGPTHYAWAYPGSDADARLSNALTAASAGHTIYLESADYGNTTISQAVELVGTGISPDSTVISGTWTLDSRHIQLTDCQVSGTLDVTTDFYISITDIFSAGGTITVSASRSLISDVVTNGAGSITLESGSENCVVDSVAGGMSITDNGTNNTIGDTA